jgi:glyoxylase-like metal-dependent hydrolase (beta-lactamase superfamily II)
MTVKPFVVSPFAENCYVCHDAGEAVLIDPGTDTSAERDAVLDYLTRNGLVVRHLLLTHAHIDHILGCAFFAREFGMKWKLHEADLPLLESAELQARMFGVELERPPTPDASLREGEAIRFGKATWEIFHTPGHSPGSVSFYDEANGFVLGGDVLFQGSIGRTDLWGGSMPTLLNAIQRKLMPLPDDTVVYSGHGPQTTIGAERRTNPFLADTGAVR